MREGLVSPGLCPGPQKRQHGCAAGPTPTRKQHGGAGTTYRSHEGWSARGRSLERSGGEGGKKEVGNGSGKARQDAEREREREDGGKANRPRENTLGEGAGVDGRARCGESARRQLGRRAGGRKESRRAGGGRNGRRGRDSVVVRSAVFRSGLSSVAAGVVRSRSVWRRLCKPTRWTTVYVHRHAEQRAGLQRTDLCLKNGEGRLRGNIWQT